MRATYTAETARLYPLFIMTHKIGHGRPEGRVGTLREEGIVLPSYICPEEPGLWKRRSFRLNVARHLLRAMDDLSEDSPWSFRWNRTDVAFFVHKLGKDEQFVSQALEVVGSVLWYRGDLQVTIVTTAKSHERVKSALEELSRCSCSRFLTYSRWRDVAIRELPQFRKEVQGCR